jgi:glycosyltransferase involved in cell wall biosynthesis
MLEQITPLVLTYNEAPNIGRTLERLSWARDIVVVDSFSDDETLEIVSRFPQARVFQRQFDTHREQWNFGLRETGITSDWVLALDADYLLTPELIAELQALQPPAATQAYEAKFRYCVEGRPLRGSAYPDVTVLYRRAGAAYVQDGHTQRVTVPGRVEHLQSPILHDDRKPLAHWVRAQMRYMKLEAEKLWQADSAGLCWPDRLRKMRVIAPFFMLLYCLFVKGAVLSGRVGFYYAFQRMFAELLLSLFLFEQDLKSKKQVADVEAGNANSELPLNPLTQGSETLRVHPRH